MGKLKAVILKAPGTNCDREMRQALTLAGAVAVTMDFFQAAKRPKSLYDYDMLVLPGGFSYGDYLGSGKVFSLMLEADLAGLLLDFATQGRTVLGVCNGFQVLVNSGLFSSGERKVTLRANALGRFECRWVKVGVEADSVLAKRARKIIKEDFELPIAHAEGRFTVADQATLAGLRREGSVFLRYRGANPNGSDGAVAGITNVMGNVIGMMPHPERFVALEQHYHRHSVAGTTPWGLEFFTALVSLD